MNTVSTDSLTAAAHSETPVDSVRAAVSGPDVATRVQYLDPSRAIGAVGWLRVESSAVCGTDVALYRKGLATPTVLGHHVVGTVTAIEDAQGSVWGVQTGDRVALEEYLPCLKADCAFCASGDYRLCPETDLWIGKRRVGLISAEDGCGLHGGNAEYMQLSRNSVVHRLPADLDANMAAWTQPFANALDWVIDTGGAREGSTVAIIGPGYHGIAAVAAAQVAGAARVLVVGLPESSGRLEIAEAMGATPVLNDRDDLAVALDRATGGRGVDVLLDTVGLGAEAVRATSVLRHRGRLVVGGLGANPIASLDLSAMVQKVHTIVGVRGRSPGAVKRSIALLAEERTSLRAVPSVDVELTGVGELLDQMAAGRGPVSPHIVVRPQTDNYRKESLR